MSGEATLGIGEVARRVGVRPSTVRYYEEQGLIAPESRSGGKRVYAREAAERMALDAMSQRIDVMRAALQRISRCGCRDLDQCARGIAAKIRR